MHLIRPLAGLRPAHGRAADVAAPPYDVLSTEEARARAAGKPWSFLHISKPEIDLPSDTDPYSPAVYAKAAQNLARMLAEGVLERDKAPAFYAYRLVMGEHVQTGVVAAASVEAYDTQRIRKHEFTRPDKEDDRVRQISALNAQTGPVLLAHPDHRDVADLLTQATQGDPFADVVADTGVRHSIWRIGDAMSIEVLIRAFDAMPALYIADGHHRSAAASRVCAARRQANAGHTGQEGYNTFLAVIFPHSQMNILPYNRLVADLHGLSRAAFLERLQTEFLTVPSSEPVTPAKPGDFGLYLPGQWYRLGIRSERMAVHDPVARLDVSLLADYVLAPILGIRDPRRDTRIDFVGGIRGLRELEQRVDRGGMAAAFSLFPTRMQDLMAVADTGAVMPPKSTWFEPKLADGLVSHVLD
ncbi:MAG: DUF1015 domain-containing protein [Burkholderiales bacterium]